MVPPQVDIRSNLIELFKRRYERKIHFVDTLDAYLIKLIQSCRHVYKTSVVV
jgi:hypothetical protein